MSLLQCYVNNVTLGSEDHGNQNSTYHNLESCKLVEITISSSSVLGVPLGFTRYKIMLYVNNDSFTFSF